MDSNFYVISQPCCETAGKIDYNSRKQIFIEKCVALHLGKLKRGFDAGKLTEEMIENVDETIFYLT